MLISNYYDNFGGERIVEDQLNRHILALFKACQENSSCEVIELRQDSDTDDQCIIAEFLDGTFEVDNKNGIQRVERLAIRYVDKPSMPWEVRALRKDFPYTSEQQDAPPGQPRLLCLYLATWPSIQRSWTPQLFLKQIFWWLRATAEGTIHSADQPLERVFFGSNYLVLLPRGYFEDAEQKLLRNLVFKSIPDNNSGMNTLVGYYQEEANQEKSFCRSFPMLLPPVEYGPVEGMAHTLGQLDSIFRERGSEFLVPLANAICEAVGEGGVDTNNEAVTLLLLGIPRTFEGQDCGFEIQGFIALIDFCELGEKLGLLNRMPGAKTYYKAYPPNEPSDDWRGIPIDSVNARAYPSKQDIRRYSDIPADDEGPTGIIAGVGALGGLLAEIWNRECWGDWHYADSDFFQAHNFARHIATHHAVGHPKARVVSDIVNNIHPGAVDPSSRVIEANIESEDSAVKEVIQNASLLVDVTTTTHVPRVAAQCDEFPRTVSVYLTPSGQSAVMLLEDEGRSIRSNSLEAQYYRAILESDWGKNHLKGNKGTLWVGGGCREVTLPLSNEILHLHSGNLARQIRAHIQSSNAKISVWEYKEESGATVLHEVGVYSSRCSQLGEWQLHLDNGFISNAEQLRNDALPAETGGVLLGIVDQADKTITLVKAWAAPPNSTGTEMEFTRAGYNSNDFMQNCSDRTAGIVTYIGEWHSHPKGVAPIPSQADLRQHATVNATLLQEGRPALMMIISETTIGLYLEGQGVVIGIANEDLSPLAKAG